MVAVGRCAKQMAVGVSSPPGRGKSAACLSHERRARVQILSGCCSHAAPVGPTAGARLQPQACSLHLTPHLSRQPLRRQPQRQRGQTSSSSCAQGSCTSTAARLNMIYLYARESSGVWLQGLLRSLAQVLRPSQAPAMSPYCVRTRCISLVCLARPVDIEAHLLHSLCDERLVLLHRAALARAALAVLEVLHSACPRCDFVSCCDKCDSAGD